MEASDVAAPDVPRRSCAVGVSSLTGTDRGRVGGDGGGDNFPPLECAPSDRLVGIALRMSDQDTIYGQRSAHGIRIACAPVTIDPAGVGTTGTITTHDVSGNGMYGWSPSQWTPITQCKPGWIMSGLSAHTTNGGDLFLDASITCSQLDVMAATVATETLYVEGSLDEPAGLDMVSCNAGETSCA